ncbi:10517_t:CDS:1 [Paraglomus occultum]|uniref:10517_t:CDS:1 n=1 Tax=Paraglomus occultum TaxID=144539 RepID=A0A9N9FQN0_9GLOM|nr:10517_t:CDS:1 [Paraglomus occultum]
MKSAHLLFLLVLVVLIFDPTPASASPLGKRWTKSPCCPISRCVFKQGDNFVNAAGFAGNTFNGFLEFMQSPNDTLEISGWIDIHGTINGAVESFYDIHVANCSTASTDTPGDPAIIDLDNASFSTPILASRSLSINNITNKCCFVVEEFASLGGSIPPNERIYGVAPVEDVVSCVRNTSTRHLNAENIQV